MGAGRALEIRGVILGDTEEKSIQEKVELSIRKQFHKELFSSFAKAINEYELLKPGDHVAVCISGGKDSFLMAKLFQELKKHNKFPFELSFIAMNPGYLPENRKLIEENAKNLGIPISIFESPIFEAVTDVTESPCYLCARMRRGYLYKKAEDLGCNKIALGHHYDDVIETILMGMLYGAQIQTMMPKIHSQNFPGMELIRPMYMIRESDILKWRDRNGLRFLQCACRFTEEAEKCMNPSDMENSSKFWKNAGELSKRKEIKQLIKKLKETNPYVESNIFSSVDNVNLRTILSYKENGIRHPFTEWYDEE